MRFTFSSFAAAVVVLMTAAVVPVATAGPIVPTTGVGLSVETEAGNSGSASYTYNGGLTSNPGTGTLVTVPVSMMLGLNAGSLYLSGASTSATAYSAADLGTGELHADANSLGIVVGTGGTTSGTDLTAFSDANFTDTLTFSVSGGGPVNIGINTFVDGTADFATPLPGDTLDANYIWTSTLEFDPSLGGQQNYYYQSFYQGGFGPELDGPFNVVTGFTNESNLGYDFSDSVSVVNGESVTVYLDLNLQSAQGVDLNFSNTGGIGLDLPAGVTFTSQSGDFLSAPEPASLLLMGAGLVGFGLVRRKIRQRS
jgi:hypothetical protein